MADPIPPESYPQPMNRREAARAAAALRRPALVARAEQSLKAQAAPMRVAVQNYVEALAEANGNVQLISDLVHEIRGLATTAGLPVTGRICESLLQHMEQEDSRGKIMALHVEAIVRAASSEPEKASVSEEVATNLAVLVARQRQALKGR